MPIKASINPIFNVFEQYSKQVIINPYRYLSMKSVSLNGSSQYLTITPVAGLELTTITVCVWIKRTNTSSPVTVSAYFPKGAHNDGRGWQLDSQNATYDRVFFNDADGAWGVINGTIPTTAWKFLMFTYQSSLGELFVDNISKGTLSEGLIYTDGGGANPPSKFFTIGAQYWNGAWGNYFNGLITGFAIFNKVLDSTERAWLYNSGKVRDYQAASFFGASCKMYLPFNNTFNDLSGNGNHATAVNSPTFSTDIP